MRATKNIIYLKCTEYINSPTKIRRGYDFKKKGARTYVEDRVNDRDFIVDPGITHVPMDTSNVRPKRACRVMNLRPQADI